MKYCGRTKVSAVFVLLLSWLAAVSPGCSGAYAADPADKLVKIKEKIETTLQDLTDVKKEEESVVSQMKRLSTDIGDKEKELGRYTARISRTRAEIRAVEKEVELLNKRLQGSQQYMEEHIVALFKRQYKNDAMILISSDDYNDLIRKSRYISLAAYHNNKILNEYKDKLKRLNSRKKKLEELQAGLNAHKADISRKKNEFQADLAKKDKLLAEVKARRAAQEKKMKELEAASGRLAGMVNRLKAGKVPDSLLGGGFRSKRGDLPWPVKGRIIASFGKYKDPEFKIGGFRNGIKILAESENALSVAGGRVVYANEFKGFGNMLIIDHGEGYHSLYGNLSEMSLKTGDLVMHGMNVGHISRPGGSNGPVLYFEIRYKGKPADPADWLK